MAKSRYFKTAEITNLAHQIESIDLLDDIWEKVKYDYCYLQFPVFYDIGSQEQYFLNLTKQIVPTMTKIFAKNMESANGVSDKSETGTI